MKLAGMNDKPAIIICHDELTREGVLLLFFFEKSDPAHQAIGLMSISSIPVNCEPSTPPDMVLPSDWPNNSSTPPNPSSIPLRVNLSRKLTFQLGLSNTRNQMGLADTMMPTMELGSVFSTQITVPVPMVSIKRPLMPDEIIFLTDHILSPLLAHQLSNRTPAVRNRRAPMSIGGKPC